MRTKTEEAVHNEPVDTVIFDIGGVLVELGRFRFLAKRGFTGDLARRVMQATMRSDDWVQLDLGNLPEEEILQLFIENDPEIEQEIRHMFADVNGIVEKKEASLPWLQRLRASGRRVLFLSNYSHKIIREAAEVLYFLPAMDGGLFSCDVHLVKPDPAFYEELIRRYDLVPERCVFIDDLPANLEPAKKLGIRTILFRSQEQAERDLERLLG